MSTSPDTTATEDRLIAVISKWLGRHIGNEELGRSDHRERHGRVEPRPGRGDRELAAELDQVAPGERGHVEMVARETVEVLALGE